MLSKKMLFGNFFPLVNFPIFLGKTHRVAVVQN